MWQAERFRLVREWKDSRGLLNGEWVDFINPFPFDELRKASLLLAILASHFVCSIPGLGKVILVLQGR